MTLLEACLILFLVVDPFGNLPFILAILQKASAAAYRRIIVRELLIAFVVLLGFLFGGELVLHYLQIHPASIRIAGGVILFLISLKMIFQRSSQLFNDEYQADPLIVPIAIPSIAGPSSLTLVMLLQHQADSLWVPLWALVIVFVLNLMIFLPGRYLAEWMGERGLRALEKLMGMILVIVAVNMMLTGVAEFIRTL